MGMAATQAQLIFIRSRKSDVRFGQQGIASQQILNSRKANDISEEYNRSLNARKLVFAMDGSNPVDLSYDLLMSSNATNTTSQYMITDNNNRVVLSDAYISKLGLSGDSGNLGSMDRAGFLEKFGLDASLFEDPYVAPTPKTPDPVVDNSSAATNTLSENMSSMAELMNDGKFSEQGSTVLRDPVYQLMKEALVDIDKNIKTALADPTLTVSQKDMYTKIQTNNEAAKVAIELARNSSESNVRMGAIASIKYLFAGTAFKDSLPTITVQQDRVYKGEKGSFHGFNPTRKKHTTDGGQAILEIDRRILTDGSGLHAFKIQEDYVDNMGDMTASLSLSGAFNTKQNDEMSEKPVAPVAQTDQAKADFYTNLYYAVAAKGWSKNNNVTDSSYLSNQLINGGMQLQKLSSDGKWSQSAMSDPSSPIRNVRDTEAAERAKAKYDMERDQLNEIDTRLNIEMKNKETECAALETMEESVEGVLKKNIEIFKTMA